jgi:SET domain-containing protein
VGLFVFDTSQWPNEIVFRSGNRICPYFGEIINKAELDQRYGDHTAPYGIELSADRFQDRAAQRGIGTLINHTTRAASNCRFTNNRQFITITATKPIRNDQELLISYGNDYLFNEPGVRYSTNTRRR